MFSDCADIGHVARHPGKCAASVAAQSGVEPEHQCPTTHVCASALSCFKGIYCLLNDCRTIKEE